MEKISTVLKPKVKLISIVALITAILAGLLSLIQPLKYSASVRLLITQRAALTFDPYTALRSTELIAENLAQVVSTSSFLERVLQSGYKIDAQYFSGSEQYRRRLWNKTVETDLARGTGMLRVAVYHPNRDEAIKIVSAIAFLLSTQGSEYIGRDITVRLVDAPLLSRFPVQPNIPLNIVAGAVLGALLGSAWVWVDHRQRRHHGQLLW
ncbi:MAG: hypothetical protein UX17_C0011G0013 [Parcubacteria group bacterium GW2011_GWC2_45_7]|nr:MAG: hypothetical protein UX17_C0011G0013 [Parcubacteria group bacterium GW2011_GWC2_45_7]KKU73665.1 MAG: hypothetical protein UX98_C0005G0041 [Parcubacteria group bacterium GW2011_GWA2_47_26]